MAQEILAYPAAYRHLGPNAVQRVRDEYSSAHCLPRIADFYANAPRSAPAYRTGGTAAEAPGETPEAPAEEAVEEVA